MRGQTSKFAIVKSDEQLEFKAPYDGGTTLILTLRKSAKGTSDAYFSIGGQKGQFICGFEGCQFTLKFDHGPLLQFHGSEPSDGSTTTLFVSPSANFLRKLKKAKVLTMETTYFEEGEQQVTFYVSGLDWK